MALFYHHKGMKNVRIKSLFIIIICGLFVLQGCTSTTHTNQVQNSQTSQTVNGNQEDQSIIVPSISDGKYAYERLSDEGQMVYDQVLYTLLNHAEKIEVSTNDAGVLRQAHDSVHMDYGGIFWVEGYTYQEYYAQSDQVDKLMYIPTYTKSEEERAAIQQEIDGVVNLWLSEVPADADDYEKSKYVYEKLINEVDYVLDSEENQNIISTFLNRQTVCLGYANAAAYMLTQLGLQAAVVSGTNEAGESHAWNLVQLDDSYYYMDVTYGNSRYRATDEENIEKRVNYAYLNVTGEELLRQRELDVPVPLPVCSDTENNYHVREGFFFKNLDGDAVARTVGEEYQSGADMVSLKFATDESFEANKTYLFDGKHFNDYCPGLSQISFVAYPDVRVVTIHFQSI